MRERIATPEAMISDGQVAQFGVFKEPFKEVNLLDYELKIKGKEVPRFLRDFRLKEWEHFGIVHDDYYFGMVIFDAKFMGTSFFYAFNRGTGEFFEHSRTGLGNPLRVARELWHGECHYRHIGYLMEFDNRLDDGFHRLRANIKAKKEKPSIAADIRVLDDIDKIEPLVMVSPLGEGRPEYTHKVAAPVEGTITLGDLKVTLDPEKHVALMDIQKSYFWYNTIWKWATFGGFDPDGRLIAMNACQGLIPESEDERVNENCTWVDGKITALSAARFEFNETALLDPWKVKTTAGELDLDFKPAGERIGKINLGAVMSDFHQPFGLYNGTVVGPGGTEIPVSDKFGVCEYHMARF